MTTEQHVEPDWAAKQTDRVIDLVDKVKAQTTDRAVVVLRVIVFGLVIAVLAVAAVVLVLVAGVRMADAYLPIGAGVGDATWAAHGFIGLILSTLGVGAWMSRRGEGKPMPLIIAGIVVGLVLFTFVILAIASLF